MRADFTAIQTQGQQGGSSVLDRVIKFVGDAFSKIGDVVNNDRIVSVTFAAGALTGVQVQHSLGFVPKSWDVVDLDTDARIWRSDNAAGVDSTQVFTFNASAPCNAKIRFA